MTNTDHKCGSEFLVNSGHVIKADFNLVRTYNKSSWFQS